MPTDLRFRPVEPGMSSPGVTPTGGIGEVVELVAGLPVPTKEAGRGEGGERPNCLAGGDEMRSESTTSVARPKIWRFPTKFSISLYMDSLNSRGNFLVLHKSLFASLLIPHQFADPVPSM